MNLSENFTLEELTHSQTATRHGIDNRPDDAMLQQLKKLAENLEGVRRAVGTSIHVSSAYRCPLLNKAVGSSPSSQHVKGEAADITAPRLGSPKELIRAIVRGGVVFDQCILEFNSWVHISFSDNPRRQLLVIDANGTRPYSV